jgi:adenylate cyclase
LQSGHEGQGRQRVPRHFHSEIVGREAELDSLMRHYDNLLFGTGRQVVAVTGEGGVGKTRLISEWQQRAANLTRPEEAATWVMGYGHSYGQRAHGLFIELLEQLLGITAEDNQSERWHKLAERLQQSFAGAGSGWLESFNNRLAYLGHFLGLDLSLRRGLAGRVSRLEGEARQLQTRLAVCDLVEQMAQQRPEAASGSPLLFVLEDLHWADQASLDLLQFMIGKLPDNLPLLYCLVFRLRRERPIWQTWQAIYDEYHADCHLIELAELRENNSQRLLFNLLQSDQLPLAWQKLIIEETDGNPLYLEEVLHALIEEGTLRQVDGAWQLTQSIERVRVPDTLYQMIQSRVDDLDFDSPGARRVLWLAAVVGLQFTEDVLLHLFRESGREEAEFRSHLLALRNADMLRRARVESGTAVRPGFAFRHGLVQQVAYENMLLSTRRRYHAQVGRWLEETYTADLPRYFDDLAYHFDQGEQWRQAFYYHWQVGERDAQAYANESALFHLHRAVALSPAAKAEPETVAQVQLALGKVLLTTGDFAAARTHLQVAYDLFGQGETAVRAKARICYEIGRLHELQGEQLDVAWEWRDRGLALLPALPTPEAAMLQALGSIVRLRQGRFSEADAEANQTLVVAEAAGSSLELSFAHRLLSISLRTQGHLAEAMAHCRQSLAICEEIGDLMGQVKNSTNLGILTFELDDWRAAEAAYQQATTLLARVSDRHQLGLVQTNLADLLYHLGDLAQCEQTAQQALALAEKMGATQQIITVRVVLALVAWRQGELERALAELAEAGKGAETAVMFQPTVDRALAQVYLTAGDLSRAAALLEKWRGQEEDVLADEAEPIQRLYAELLAARGEREQAIQILAASLGRLETAGLRYQSAQAMLALAGVLAEMDGRQPEARHYAEEALAIFKQLGARLDTAETEALLAKLSKE